MKIQPYLTLSYSVCKQTDKQTNLVKTLPHQKWQKWQLVTDRPWSLSATVWCRWRRYFSRGWHILAVFVRIFLLSTLVRFCLLSFPALEPHANCGCNAYHWCSVDIMWYLRLKLTLWYRQLFTDKLKAMAAVGYCMQRLQNFRIQY